jgi:hypothetical protein
LDGALIELLNPPHEGVCDTDGSMLQHNLVPYVVQSFLTKSMLKKMAQNFFESLSKIKIMSFN